jgi:hypothetical protein
MNPPGTWWLRRADTATPVLPGAFSIEAQTWAGRPWDVLAVANRDQCRRPDRYAPTSSAWGYPNIFDLGQWTGEVPTALFQVMGTVVSFDPCGESWLPAESSALVAIQRELESHGLMTEYAQGNDDGRPWRAFYNPSDWSSCSHRRPIQGGLRALVGRPNLSLCGETGSTGRGGPFWTVPLHIAAQQQSAPNMALARE